MDPANLQSTAVCCHMVAVPVPARSHMNPMMSLCKLLASKTNDILITIVVTEEWLGVIESDHSDANSKPNNLRFATIPNVVSERLLAADLPAFYEAVTTKMEGPFEQLLNQLEQTVTSIITDIELYWPIRFGNRRNIPVATLVVTSAKFFSRLQYFSQIKDQNLLLDLLEKGDESVDVQTGVSSREMRTIYHLDCKRGAQISLLAHAWVPKSQYLLINSVYELEPQVFDTLKPKYSFPIYSIGPAVPYMDLEQKSSSTTTNSNAANYLEWLDSQAAGSVLYVSLGSFISVANQQIDEISAGLQSSGVKYFWVARGESSRCGDKGCGFVVPWCDQLRVLCHASVGGFLTHCGWNSTLEALFAGVPLLTFPIVYDQVSNDEQIVKEWDVGWRVGGRVLGDESLVSREEISERVKKFMDEESVEVQNLRQRARRSREIFQRARAEGGSSETNLDAFIKHVTSQSSLPQLGRAM